MKRRSERNFSKEKKKKEIRKKNFGRAIIHNRQSITENKMANAKQINFRYELKFYNLANGKRKRRENCVNNFKIFNEIVKLKRGSDVSKQKKFNATINNNVDFFFNVIC